MGDLEMFASNSVAEGGDQEIMLSGHAQEFVQWCAAPGGDVLNGVELPPTKEVSCAPV